MSKSMREIVVHLVLAQFVQGSLKVPWGKEQHTNLQQKTKKKKDKHETNNNSDML